MLRAGKQGYSTFSILAAALGTVPSRLVLPCDGAVQCFVEKPRAARTGTAPSMLLRHASQCPADLGTTVQALENEGTFLPYCGEFLNAANAPPTDLGQWM